MASLFTAKGQEAVKSANKKNIDLKQVYIRLKDGESIRVRLLGITDNTVREYMAQGDFNLGIYTQPDISPLLGGNPSPLTVASNSGIEKFEKLYAKKRYLIVFADLDAPEGQNLRVWDCSKAQGQAMQDLMKEYDESKDEVAFTFKRTGNKTETTFNLIPIMKLKAEDKVKFEKLEGIVVPEDFLDNVLIPRTEAQQIEALAKAGFPVADFFSADTSTDTDTEEEIEDIAESDIANM